MIRFKDFCALHYGDDHTWTKDPIIRILRGCCCCFGSACNKTEDVVVNDVVVVEGMVCSADGTIGTKAATFTATRPRTSKVDETNNLMMVLGMVNV